MLDYSANLYLESLLNDKLSNIIKFFSPFALLVDYVKKYLENKGKNTNGYLLKIGLSLSYIILASVPLAAFLIQYQNSHLTFEDPVGKVLFNFTVFAPLTNSFTLFLILLFSGYFSLNRVEDINKKVDNLIGHQLWTEPKTFNTLNSLLNQQTGRKSKAFILKFMSYLVEDRIVNKTNNHSHVFQISTGLNVWPISRYSKFLSANMDRAEERILWLVDLNDFFAFHLPELIKYSLAIRAINVFPWIVSDEYSKDVAIQKIVDKFGENTPDDMPKEIWQLQVEKIKRYFTKMAIKDESNKQIDIADNTTLKFVINNPSNDDLNNNVNCFDMLLNILACCGYCLYELQDTYPSVAVRDIESGFNKFSNKFLDHIYPHFGAFRRAQVKQKKRIFCINSPTNDDYINQLKNAISTCLNNQKEYWIQLADLGITKKDIEQRIIINSALNLFEITCGGKKNIVVRKISIKKTPLFSQLDLGVYDSNYIVSSKKNHIEKKQECRIITWYYGFSDVRNENHWSSIIKSEYKDIETYEAYRFITAEADYATEDSDFNDFKDNVNIALSKTTNIFH